MIKKQQFTEKVIYFEAKSSRVLRLSTPIRYEVILCNWQFLFNDDVDADDVIMTMYNTCISFDHDLHMHFECTSCVCISFFFHSFYMMIHCRQCDAPKRCNNFDICIEKFWLNNPIESVLLNRIEGIQCEQDHQYP